MNVPPHELKWNEFVAAAQKLRGAWVFRGELYAPTRTPPLETSLEKACRCWDKHINKAGEIEKQLLREFKRHPETRGFDLEQEDDLDWLAVMQHYGAPTRLLDWTYSPFVAAYFAFDKLLYTKKPDPKKPDPNPPRAAIWAVNYKSLNHAIRKVLSVRAWSLYLKKDSSSFANLYFKRHVAFVGAVNPMKLNNRLSIQQGLFLVPGDVGRPWAQNFEALKLGQDEDKRQLFLMDRTQTLTAFKALTLMNVSSRILFPGPTGYAKSLLHRLPVLPRGA